jgi:hypothetical protein
LPHPVEVALLRLMPGIPAWDRAEVVGHALAAPGLRKATPETAAWLSAVAFIRHVYTDYDTLLNDGWGAEAARHFVLPAINAVLAEWGCRRRVSGEDGGAADND